MKARAESETLFLMLVAVVDEHYELDPERDVRIIIIKKTAVKIVMPPFFK